MDLNEYEPELMELDEDYEDFELENLAVLKNYNNLAGGYT